VPEDNEFFPVEKLNIKTGSGAVKEQLKEIYKIHIWDGKLRGHSIRTVEEAKQAIGDQTETFLRVSSTGTSDVNAIFNRYIPLYEERFGRAFGEIMCPLCNRNPLRNMDHGFERGYVQLLRLGGLNHINNIRPICHRCKERMGERHMADFVLSEAMELIGKMELEVDPQLGISLQQLRILLELRKRPLIEQVQISAHASGSAPPAWGGTDSVFFGGRGRR
jgi:hypothetical protein